MKRSSLGKSAIERWLMIHGGRTLADMKKDWEDKRYVLMWDGRNHEYVNVYPPEWITL